jgi:coenzyme Q-binding protein COQ10
MREAIMPAIHAQRRVNHSAHEMFDLVADVERYPEFVPHCQKHVIVSRKKTGNTEVLITDMTVGRGPFRETMRSRDTLDRKNGRILVEAVTGPLERLQTMWRFQPRDDASCEISFDLSYQFSSLVMELLARSIFEATFSRFVQAFERRADNIYGYRGRRSQDHQKYSRGEIAACLI